jgi:hypothetical protein
LQVASELAKYKCVVVLASHENLLQVAVASIYTVVCFGPYSDQYKEIVQVLIFRNADVATK